MEKSKTKSGANGKTTMSKEMPKKASAKEKENDSQLVEFFHDELKDIYWAEKHLVKTLPKMARAATSDELRDAVNDHLEVTKEHVTRLESIFSILGYKPQAKKCDAMEGLTKEGESILEDTEDGSSTRDVGIIMAAQKVEHYEIATYGSLAQLSQTLGYDTVTPILQQTLSEEKEADQGLTALAENTVNEQAAAEV